AVAVRVQQGLRVHPHVEPVHAPVHVRAGGPAGGADRADRLPGLDAVADLHVDAAHVQEVRTDAVAVVDQHGADGQVEIGTGEGDHAGRWRQHRGTGWGRHVQAGMRRARGAVVNALAAVDAADPPGHRPAEAGGEIAARIVAFAGGADLGLLAGDAGGDLRVRGHGLLRHAVYPFDLPIACLHR